MAILGIDVSHHQGAALDFKAFAADGIQFAIIKATEGANFLDDQFTRNLARAQAAGLLVAAYHYVRGNASAADQVAFVRRVVPAGIPVIPDVEANSGSIVLTRDFVARLKPYYRVPFLYIPRWYWQQIGSPSLSGLPPLWSSRYPDKVVRPVREQFSRAPSAYWVGYGGLDVQLLQFTATASVAGVSPLDANAYGGTREQLATLFGNTREANVKDKLAKKTNDPQVWFGNGHTRRKVTATQLEGLKFWMTKEGLDTTVQVIDDLDGVMGMEQPAMATVDLDYDRFLNDVVERLAAKVSLEFEPVVPPTATT